MPIVNFDPAAGGQAFQGDIYFMPVPAGIPIATADEIKPRDNLLIIQEGEVTGHHHAIDLLAAPARKRAFRPAVKVVADPLLATRDTRLRRALGGAKPGARLYRDPTAAQTLVRAGLLTRTDIMVGFLIADRPVVVRHDEHDGIALPAGRYFVGRQIESVGAEARIVQD